MLHDFDKDYQPSEAFPDQAWKEVGDEGIAAITGGITWSFIILLVIMAILCWLFWRRKMPAPTQQEESKDKYGEVQQPSAPKIYWRTQQSRE
jgi:hypothetical protein